jgi:hypothetical protein
MATLAGSERPRLGGDDIANMDGTTVGEARILVVEREGSV